MELTTPSPLNCCGMASQVVSVLTLMACPHKHRSPPLVGGHFGHTGACSRANRTSKERQRDFALCRPESMGERVLLKFHCVLWRFTTPPTLRTGCSVAQCRPAGRKTRSSFTTTDRRTTAWSESVVCASHVGCPNPLAMTASSGSPATGAHGRKAGRRDCKSPTHTMFSVGSTRSQ